MTDSTNNSTPSQPAPAAGAAEGSPAAKLAPLSSRNDLPDPPIVLRLPDLDAPNLSEIVPAMPNAKPPSEDSPLTVYLLATVLMGVIGFLAFDHWQAGHGAYRQPRAAQKRVAPGNRRSASASSPATGQSLSSAAPNSKAVNSTVPGKPRPAGASPVEPDPTAKRPTEDRQAKRGASKAANVADASGRGERVAGRPPMAGGSPAPVAQLEGVIEKPNPGPTYDHAQ